jgi:hypothetical protein
MDGHITAGQSAGYGAGENINSQDAKKPKKKKKKKKKKKPKGLPEEEETEERQAKQQEKEVGEEEAFLWKKPPWMSQEQRKEQQNTTEREEDKQECRRKRNVDYKEALWVGSGQTGVSPSRSVSVLSANEQAVRLAHAIAANDLGALARAVKGGASVVSTINGRGYTPLHFAAAHGHVESMEWLVAHGGDITAVGNGGETLLSFAASTGHVPAMEWLVESQGADVGAVSHGGEAALSFAASGGHLQAMIWLVDNGAEIGACGKGGTTALHRAVGNGRVAAAEWLVNHIKDARTLDLCANCPLSPTPDTEPIMTRLVELRDERANKLKTVRKCMATKTTLTGDVRGKGISDAKEARKVG